MNWLLLKNSILVSGLTTLLATGLGFISALWLSALGRTWRTRFLVLGILSLVLPPFLVTNCWLDLLGYTGIWRTWLPFNIVSLGGAVWILSLLLWPITLLFSLGAWKRLDAAQLESDVAVTGRRLILSILLPTVRVPLVQAAVLTFVLALNNFSVPAILQVKVFPAEVWVRFTNSLDSFGALKLSWPLILAPLLLLIWIGRREIAWPQSAGTVSSALLRQQLGQKWFSFCGVCSILLCSLSVGAPFLDLIFLKRTWSELFGALAAGQTALWNSFSYAAISATLVVVTSLLIATLVRSAEFQSAVAQSSTLRSLRKSEPSSIFAALPITDRRYSTLKICATIRRTLLLSLRRLRSLLWLPLLVPGVLLGIMLIHLFNHSWSALLYQSSGIVILAFVIRYFVLGLETVAYGLRAVDQDLTDDAMLNGATHWQMLRYVHWPQIAPQVAAAWYIVFLLCLWDVESMILVWPPGGETLALRIFNLLHYGHNAQVNALCMALLGLALLPLLAQGLWSAARRTYSAFKSPAIHKLKTATLIVVIGLGTILFQTGCSRQSPGNEVPLASQVFSSAKTIGSRGVGVGQLNKPRSVATDSMDNFYAVDMTGRVQKFSPRGEFLLSWQMPQTDLGKPKGMGRDRDGNIIVLEPHYQRVNHYTPEGKLVAQWGQKGTNDGQFMLPRSVAVNSRGEIYVSEYGAMERVQCFAWNSGGKTPAAGAATQVRAPEARFLNSFGHPGTGPGEFNRAEGLCVDSQERIYVADSCNHRIQIFSPEGRFIRTYGKAGKGRGELSYPYDIQVDRTGRQYVCEFGNSRIQVFDAEDRPIEVIGGPGAEPGWFNNPWGLALDSAGNLYVADSQNHRVQKLLHR